MKALPEKGRIGIHNRSYYEEVLVVRVHPELLMAQRLPETIRESKGIWRQRFDQINGFEKYLVANGVVVLKFYLNVSRREQKKRFLPGLASGETIGAFALAEGPQPTTATNLTTRVENEVLTGTKVPVADGDCANFAVVLAADADGGSLYLVDLDDSGVARTTVATLDPTRSHASIELRAVAVERLGDAGAGWRQTDQIFDRAAVLFAFEQVGGAHAALDMAKEYALGRFAFGRPIASFQAIKHKLADMYIAATLARSNCYYGAWALSTNAAELPVAAATARVSASQAFHECSKENIQTHGGMGFTWEFNCHLYYRRAKLLSVNLGSLPRWKNRLITNLETSNALSA